ncbi:MAG TPA: hypothetical protein VKY19_07645 [Ktedonosporobacter sp.]|nr:hypothetical protein [Ktedonosporobacter sp.]
MTTELRHRSLVQVNSALFRQGINNGASWYFHGDTLCRPVTEEDIVDFLQDNVVELAQEGLLDIDRLRSNADFLIGWILAQTLPLSAQTERSGF